ncbi:hypothetical protein [Methanococcus maripaludis]|uniref:Uncharacterized protein n=1 Tax=Methanococcus maripaludis TaxID=39152 RepID=A0A7J9PNZ0_METMI|nr:hypothetical protein [Methanococcus maripaludis]MBA2864430.1 hypothetical protein [Methanococcus maripaludis]
MDLAEKFWAVIIVAFIFNLSASTTAGIMDYYHIPYVGSEYYPEANSEFADQFENIYENTPTEIGAATYGDYVWATAIMKILTNFITGGAGLWLGFGVPDIFAYPLSLLFILSSALAILKVTGNI